MPDNTEHLKSMLQDIINDRPEQARVTMHDYFVAKTRELSGLATQEPEPATDDDTTDDLPDEGDGE